MTIQPSQQPPWPVPTQQAGITPPPPGFDQLAGISRGRTYSAAMSYVGSTRRLTAFARGVAEGAHPAVAVLGWVFALALMPIAWAAVTCWYFIIFGLFGVFAIPFRFLRRGQRKTQHLQQQQVAYMQHMAYAASAQQHAAMVAAQRPVVVQPVAVVGPPAIQSSTEHPRQVEVPALPAQRRSVDAPADARSAVLEVLADADGHWLTAREISDGALDLGWEPTGADPVGPIRSAASRLATEGVINKGMRNGRSAEFALPT